MQKKKATVPTQIRIDADAKREATEISACIRLGMSSTVNSFLHQCLLVKRLPFRVGLPSDSKITWEAMDEAKVVACDPKAKDYQSKEERKAALNEE